MKPLILMYVFYDKNGDIKAITPIPDENYSVNFFMATFPLAEVEMFLTAQKNTFDYSVKSIEKLTGTTYALVAKKININRTRALNTYLTKVDGIITEGNTVIITNDTNKGRITVELNAILKKIYMQKHLPENQLDLFDDLLNSGTSTVYLTKRNNPYHLLFSFSFLPKSLFSVDKLYFSYNNSYTDTSVYTKKVLDGYGYIEVA